MGKKLSTALIHTGNGQACRELARTASVPETFPIYLSSAFAFNDIPSVDAIYELEAQGYIYSRIANPNSDVVSGILAAAEGEAEVEVEKNLSGKALPPAKALVFSSGMAAITSSILAFVKSGDHIIASNVLYGAVYDYFANELARFGVDVTFIDILNEDAAAHVRPNTKLVYTETISNPLMEVPDLAALSKTAHERGLLLLVDNSFATPAVARTLALGADVALYSTTKYLCGHSDITGGAVTARAELIDVIKKYQVLYGGVPSAFDCWLLARSLRTLELRMKKHSKNALTVAKFLEAHPKIERVFYPGLPSSPSHERAQRQFVGGRFGGMLSANIKGGLHGVSELVKSLEMISFVANLGGTATTITHPAKTSHRAYTEEALKKAGIDQGQLRFSIGLEDADDIIEDLSRGLDRI